VYLAQKKVTTDAGLNGHCWSFLHVCTVFSPIQIHCGNAWSFKFGFFGGYPAQRSVVGVVCAGNKALFKGEMFPQWTRTGEPIVLTWSSFEDDSCSAVLHLQVAKVDPVFI